MERADDLTCEGCLHLQVKALTGKESKHCDYCLRNDGKTRAWQPGPGELLMHLADCYINVTETGLPTLLTASQKKPTGKQPGRKERSDIF